MPEQSVNHLGESPLRARHLEPTLSVKGETESTAENVAAARDRADASGSGVLRATDIAGRASDLVGGDRDRQHGQKHDNFSRIATMWNAWLSVRKDPAAPLTAHDVGVMMVAMKLARTQSGALNLDDYIDACGYAACAGEVAQIEA